MVAERSGFSAVIDDEHLPDGIYDLRARGVDLAGNERSTDRRADGSSAALALPLRIKTRLSVGKRKRVRARGADGKRRYRIVLIEKPRSRYGRTILLRGRLTSPGGNPLVGRNVEVLEQTQSAGGAMAADRHAPHEQDRSLHLQGAPRTKSDAPVPLQRQRHDPWPDRRREVGRPRRLIDVGRPAPRRQRRGRHIPGSSARSADSDLRQAHRGPGSCAWSLADLRNHSCARQDGSLVASVSVLRDPRHGALSIPRAGPEGGRLSV